MGDIESPESTPPHQVDIFSFLPSKDFATSRKGILLISEVALSFITFVCFVASVAAAFVTAPLIEFLLAAFMLIVYSNKFSQQLNGCQWPLMDFLRCLTASIIFFVISIISMSRYGDGASKAGGVFGFIATLCFAFDCYITFNELTNSRKQGEGSTQEQPAGNDSDFESE
ncbi:CKLF-like MARVEL transmembrane domain-containing protein 3 [Megalops cyprinoides]|uniref:CKLF-like MARVEL transmembrane domain-containing protein 3 n=1 Tax=Megalops cyprinoides TaxID=118141 RepID=UPI00186405BC|nr:CKLF-like MARVEL transmembrane domain-containing protein 3 [Megalops cyprinoides]